MLAIAASILLTIITVLNLKHAPGQLNGISVAQMITNLPIVASIIGSIVAILVVGHEYRYNTISYTLTASRSRTKVLFAKLLIVTLFSAALVAVCIGIGLATYYLGLHIRHFDMPPQTLNLSGVLARTILSCVGGAWLALVIVLLVRNIVFAIVAIFMLPTVEQILTIWLKHNAAYLPSTALNQVGYLPGQSVAVFSALKGGLIFLAYIVVGWLVAWFLFLRKDAN
jgi:ABC-type transport system involved in multi-copper enzyme maturation permease subunit